MAEGINFNNFIKTFMEKLKWLPLSLLSNIWVATSASLGRWFGSVGKAVASINRECSHCQILFTTNCMETTKIKKRGRNVPFIKKLASLVHPNLWAKIFRLKFLWKWFLNVLKMCKRGKKQFSLSSPQDVESFIFYKILANLGLFSVLFTSFSHSSSNYRFNFSNIFWKKYR